MLQQGQQTGNSFQYKMLEKVQKAQKVQKVQQVQKLQKLQKLQKVQKVQKVQKEVQKVQKTQKTQKIHYSLSTEHLILKPYCKSYVKEYNQWFIDDPELLYLTGSQFLTLQQQYQNHKAWLTDLSKYTFIIFEKSNQKSTQKMIGDVNLFFSPWIQPNECQINIMIAVKQARGKGYAKEALEVVQLFAKGIYDKNEVIAKIKEDNLGSKRLFQKSGYVQINFSESFKQYELRKKIQLQRSKEEAIELLQKKFALLKLQKLDDLYHL